MSPHTYTGSENADITDNQISLNVQLKVNCGLVLNPRLNVYFELHAGTSCFSFLQNIVDGSQPIVIFNTSDKSVQFFWDLDIPNFYDKAEIDAIGDELSPLISNTH